MSSVARVPWILDGRMFAKKVKHSTQIINWRDDVCISCPNCNYNIDNSCIQQEWPGLPFGVKFEPTDQELVKHLQAKSRLGDKRLHPFIDEFIATLDGNNGIYYTHPERLPGIKKDGSSIHFFHKTFRAYANGTRKRRKIQNEDDCFGKDFRWHKTGKTKPVIENGIQIGWKKIMVLYVTPAKGLKGEKTNWVMRQYHLGTAEDEKDDEYVISKVFYQQQAKQEEATTSKVGPLTPVSSTSPRSGRQHACLEDENEGLMIELFHENDLLQQKNEPSASHEELVATINEVNQSVGASLSNSGEQCTSAFETKRAEPSRKRPLADPNEEEEEEEDCFNENFLPDVTLDSQLFGEQDFLADSQELMKNTLHCAETLKDEANEETNVTTSIPLPEGGRVADDEEPDELHTPVSPTLANIHVDSLPDIQFNETQFSSQESLSGWIRRNINFSENESQNEVVDKNVEDNQCS